MARTPREPSPTDTVHFACFACRKAFKQRGSSNWDPDVPQRPFPCPECKQPMQRFGRYFQPPPQRAARQWLKVELLFHFGERFESGTLALGNRCRTLHDTVAYLTGPTRPEAEVRAALERIRKTRTRPTNPG